MRILAVRFKNLNSLAGEWRIDFSHPDYESSGLFAITGQTGAGKSTILDAVCLALYGRTPRVGKQTKAVNEVMTRHTGECFAEVLFETREGRFLCHWSQHRARKKGTGELQHPKHEISDGVTGEPLGENIGQVANIIEKTTGMDFFRFTRSMLLAQGEFAAFLKASGDERSPLLEQITGTEIYSRISMKVHEHRTRSAETLEGLSSREQDVPVLLPEEEDECSKALCADEQEKSELEKQRSGLQTALDWRRGISRLGEELQGLEKKLIDLGRREEEFRPELVKLERAERAATLDALRERSDTLKREQGKQLTALDSIRRGVTVKSEEVYNAATAEQEAKGKRDQISQAQETQRPIINAVRQLDMKIAEKAGQLIGIDKEVEAAEAKLTESETDLHNIEDELKRFADQLADAERYLSEHAADSTLGERFAAIETLFRAIVDRHEELAPKFLVLKDVGAARDKARREGAAADQVRCEKQQQFEKASTHLRTIHDALENVLKDRPTDMWRADLELKKSRQVDLTVLRDTVVRTNQARETLARSEASR